MTAESVAKASRMKLNDFDFFLPADLIATRPAKPPVLRAAINCSR